MTHLPCQRQGGGEVHKGHNLLMPPFRSFNSPPQPCRCRVYTIKDKGHTTSEPCGGTCICNKNLNFFHSMPLEPFCGIYQYLDRWKLIYLMAIFLIKTTKMETPPPSRVSYAQGAEGRLHLLPHPSPPTGLVHHSLVASDHLGDDVHFSMRRRQKMFGLSTDPPPPGRK
jgi:hypothetical protein